MILDLHVHTTRGGFDSSLSPEALVQEVRRLGLDGVCLTEHNSGWDGWQLASLAQGLALLRGMEVETDLGHIVAFGLDGYVSGIHRARELRRVVDKAGGFMVAAHPFRRYFDGLRNSEPLTVEEAARLPLFQLVDEIEVGNGASSERENYFALQVARRLGRRGTAGSDAHSIQGLGCFTTVFEREIRTEQDLIRELKAGRYYPAQGFLEGELAPYGDVVADADLEFLR